MNSLKKSVLFVLSAVFVASLSLVPAHAQGISADVPFTFTLGKATMPAGSYRVERSGSFFVLSSLADGTTKYELLVPGGQAQEREGKPYLVFNRYGSETFLTRVVFSSTENYNLPRTSREKEIMARLSSGDEVAVLIQPLR